MNTIYDAVVRLVGDVPSGAEPIVYVFCLILCLFMIDFVSGFVRSWFYTGRKK